MKKLILFILMLTVYVNLFSQTGIISGKVIDKHTNEALPGATVAIKGRPGSTTTDNLGTFKLWKVDTGNLVLVITYVGYEDKELPVNVSNGETRTVNAVLSLTDQVGNTVVVSASKRPEKITNAPASIQIIGLKDFEQFAGSNVSELISKVQGIEYTRNGVTDITFNARGFHSAFNNRVVHIVDGRISTSALSGNLPVINRGTMIKDDLERMEIIMGPQSALYGPNAFNAVLNTTTKDPRKYQGTSASITAGSQYQFSARVRHATKINNKWAFKVTGEYSVGKEYKTYDTVYVTKYSTYDSSTLERNVDLDYRHIRGEAHIYYSITRNTDIVVSGGGSKNDWPQVTTAGRNQMRGFSYSFVQARIVNPHYYLNVYNTRGNLGTSYPITPYTRNFWNWTHKPINPLKPEVAEDSALREAIFTEESQRFNADAQYNYDFKKAGLFLVAGLNYQRERPNGFGRNLLDSFQKIDIKQYGGVIQLEKSLPWSIRFIGAVRYDHHSNLGDFFSPKLGVIKSVGDGSVRITWGRAYAMPTILHQYTKGTSTFGNGEGITYIPSGSNVNDPASISKIAPLKPEEVNTWELGYKGTIAKKLFVDINYYNGRSKNFLGTSQTVQGLILFAGDVRVYPSNPTQFNTYFNYSSVRVYGVDAGFTYSFNKFISMAVKYSWIDSDITQNDMRNDANKDGYVSLEETSLNAPNHRGIISLSLQNLCKQRVFVNVSARIVQQYEFFSGLQIGTEDGKGTRGRVMWIDKNGRELSYPKNFNWGPLGGFTTIDLSAGYRVNQMISVNMSITNLFDTHQKEFVGPSAIQRLILAELRIHVPNKKEQ